MDVVLKQAGQGVAVTVGDTVLHTVRSVPEARSLASWVQYQLGEGRSLEDIGRLLRGEPPADEAVDETILEGSIGDLRAALETGAYDHGLDALLTAETAGKNRRGALAALEKRRDEAT